MFTEMRQIPETTVIEKKTYGDNDERGGSTTRGRANAGLTLGIIGTVLGAAALWNRGNNGGIGAILGGNGSGSGSPDNVNINYSGSGGATGGSTTPFGVFEKECSDILALTNEMWALKLGSAESAKQAREVDIAEKFSLYKDTRNNLDAVNNRINNELFSLYKYTRDTDDDIRKELSDLKAQVAVANAVRPYQDKLLQCEIEKAYTAGINYTDRKTCRMIQGQLVLPSTPTVTGYAGYNACCPVVQATTEAGGGAA